MNTNLSILIFLLSIFTSTNLLGQVEYDTTIVTSASYEKLSFRIGNGTTQLFELNKKDVDVTAGKIEKVKIDTDTFGVKHDAYTGEFDIFFSRKNWKKILFDRQCVHLADEIKEFPMLHFVTDTETNELLFKNPKHIGEFLKATYQKRIDCIEASEDQFMKKYLEKWIVLIDEGSVNEFTTNFSSHFAHLHALLDLFVPVHTGDTTTCTITAKDSDMAFEFNYQTTKVINEDSTITYLYTDKVDDSDSVVKQAMSSIMGIAEDASNTKETNNIKLKIDSMQDEDKSEITIDSNGRLSSYFRIRTTSRLDVQLKEENSFFNFEIRAIDNTNKE